MNTYPTQLKRIISIIIGTLLIALATNGILIPNNLLSSGVNGIAMLFYFLFDFRVSITVMLINIPLFILGSFYLKKSYLVYSLLGMLMLSFWIELTRDFYIPTENNTLSIIVIAGLLHGIGTGIIFRVNGSTGGTDIVAKIINKYFSINMATVTLCINAVIITLSIYFFNVNTAVTTISAIFISSQVVNFVVDGVNRKRTLYIITDDAHHELLASTILKDLHRGVTMIPAIGAYTSDKKHILFTTVSVREVASARELVLSIDPSAFMTVTETSQVIGNGRGFLHSDYLNQ